MLNAYRNLELNAMRTPLIAGNWKMNTNITEAEGLASAIRHIVDALPTVEVLICPPFISLASVAKVISGSQIKLGAQNCHFESKGAFTGEISPMMLAALCQYVILGHSERRSIFAEDNTLINRKVRAAVAAGLIAVLCVGENLEDREQGRTADVIIGQMNAGLEDILSLENIVIAYEPVWAIGTGQAASGHQANHVAATLRAVLRGTYGPEQADAVRILYGGSVTAANTNEYVGQREIDGALVGGASLKANEFADIVKQTAVSLVI
jgi:triosephosphate isomerase (TIM)